MNQILIVYWSGTGNTAAMAEMVASGIREAGKEPVIIPAEEAAAEQLSSFQAAAFGCPSMGDETLEESVMEPFVEAAEKNVSGKTIGLFGSYGWGDGQWMRDWSTRMEAAGATVLNGEGLICHETPDEDGLSECVELGKALAQNA